MSIERIIKKLREIESPAVRLLGVKKLTDEEILKLAKKIEEKENNKHT